MLRQVQPEDFVLCRDPQGGEQADRFIDDVCGHEAVYDNDEHRTELDEKLVGITEEGPVRATGVYCFRGENACRKHAENASYAVHAEGVERVVITESRLDHAYADEAYETRYKAYDDGSEHVHVADAAVTVASPAIDPVTVPNTVGVPA